MQLVCSPFLPRQDIEALIKGDEVDSLESLLADPKTRSSALVLGYLIANRMIDLRIAISTETGGILHEKIGIFDDGQNTVSFNGSINETYQGWSNTGNRESFDVFLSWEKQDFKRVMQHKEEFDNLWNGRVQGVSVRKALPSFMSKISELVTEGEREFNKRMTIVNSMNFAYKPLGYQEAVMLDWSRKNNRGIVKFCTGAGKTVVGMRGVCNRSCL